MRLQEDRTAVAGIMGVMESTEQTSPGSLVLRLDVLGTSVLVVTGVLGAVSDTLARTVLAPVSAVAGALGIVLFVWSYLHAIGKSREHEISVSQLYGVAGKVAPKSVKRQLQWCLWLQVLVAVAVMAFGFSRTKPQEFNWAAVIIIVPLFGMGMNGAWVARFGTFGPRILTARPSRKSRGGRASARTFEPTGASSERPVRPTSPKKVAESHDAAGSMQQNEPHG